MTEDNEKSGAIVSIDDVLGMGAVGLRLIDAFEKACGTTFGPWRIKREAAAKAEATIIQAKADAEKGRLLAEGRMGIAERALERLTAMEVSRQENLEQIAHKAADEAARFPQGERDAEKPPVDSDWMMRFVNRAQDVSNEDMQQLWARIVAGEVNKPGTFSLRTLETLGNITQDEARLFGVLCDIASDHGFALKINRSNEFLECGIEYHKLLVLRAAGVVYDSDSLVADCKQGRHTHVNGSTFLSVRDIEEKAFQLEAVILTPEGVEIKKLTNSTPNVTYYKKLAKYLESRKLHCVLAQLQDAGNLEKLYESPTKHTEGGAS